MTGRCAHTNKQTRTPTNTHTSNERIISAIHFVHLAEIIKCHNLCSKCPPSADTQQWRRLRHSSTVSSITRCRIADHAWVNRYFGLLMSLIGDLYMRSCINPRPCNQLGSDLDCWEATDLDQWIEQAGQLFHVHMECRKRVVTRLAATTAITSRLVPGVNAFLESKK